MYRLSILLLATCAVACGAQKTTVPTSGPASKSVGSSGKPLASAVSKPVAEPFEILLAPWKGPHGGVPPWDKADPALFGAAIDRAIDMTLSEIEAIVAQTEAPTFDNTIAASERAGRSLQRAATLFFTLASSRNTPEVQALTAQIRPQLARLQDEIDFNPKLFARIEAVYKTRDTSSLTGEQLRLVEKTYENLIRRGANLSSEKKAQVTEINQELAKVFTEFSNHVLAEEDTWIVLGDKDLDGLPPVLVAAYKAAAEKREVDGYAVVNTRSAVDPFLTFSTRRDLREKVWRAFTRRGDNGNERDTNALIQRIVKLRAKRATLLGYASHAHWRMGDTMAKDPKNAMALMMRVWPAAKARVRREVSIMRRVARKMGHRIRIKPWDYRFYMEKVRERKYALDQNEFKNYFELNNMIKASYFMAERLYGFKFEEITGSVPVFHPDVRVFRVTKASDGSYVGLFYRDDFARQYKRSGAWMSNYQVQHKLGTPVDPIVSNNNNFVKGGEGEPVLISLDDAETLFHEFGHALHALSNDTTYPSLAQTPRDFVEFPSQVHENWVLTRDILDKFARHYETGEAMPQALIDKMRAASTFNSGFATVEYLAAAIVDMKLHMDPKGEIDPKAFEAKALREIGMPKEIVLRHRLPHFQHLFSSDAYSAGYYSYLWSDVMAADAWKAFEEAGDLWSPEVASRFKAVILATGDAVDRAEAYRQFRGRDPKVEALLENRGLK